MQKTAHGKRRRWLLSILALGLALRLVYALSQDHLIVYNGLGGDSGWYLDYGLGLVTDGPPGPPPTAPFYLLFVGWWQRLFAPETAIVAARIVQSLMGAAVCCFAYRMARRLTGDARAGLIAAAVLAVSPALVIEPAHIATETPYIFFVAAGLCAYLELVSRPEITTKHQAALMLIVALSFGLATLTRAVSLLFPLGLAGHFLLVTGWRAGLKQVALLLSVYTLTVSSWTVYNLVTWDLLVIGAQGMTSFLYLGAAEGGWQGWRAADANLAALAPNGSLPSSPDEQQELYREGAVKAISADPLGWLAQRAGNLADAYLQPYGTVAFPGESLKELALNWLRSDRSPGGLLRVVQGEYFWPKLAIYVFHYVGLIAGLAGLWLTRKRWRIALPLVGFILYTTLIHFVLLALPRYIFPTEVLWWVFASAALARARRAQKEIPAFRTPNLPNRIAEN